MKAITVAFQAVQKDFSAAHRVYNRDKKNGITVATCLLADVEQQCKALREHLAIEHARRKASEVTA